MIENIEFQEFPKVSRLSREMIITEKLDGTNAQVYIWEDTNESVPKYQSELKIIAGSRTKWLTLKEDNYGFAKWVNDNKQDLLNLGIGRHFGEWWGSGIQRGYNLTKGDKRFSLFNTLRWCKFDEEPKVRKDGNFGDIKYQEILPQCCHLVPELYKGMFDTIEVERQLHDLRIYGSKASPGFMKPEGVVVFHTAGNFGFKKTIYKDEIPKSLVKT